MTSANWMMFAMVGWIAILVDGWIVRVHWLSVVGVLIFMYLFWRFEDMMKDPEDEAFEDLEQRIKLTRELSVRVKVKSFDDAFNDYISNPGAPRTASDEEARRHFQAGWVAGIRNEWAKERND
jgi:hypothetical protein